MAIKVSIYEDNDSLRESLSSLIQGKNEFSLTGAHVNCDTIENDVLAEGPDVVLMDIEMPGTNGIEGLKRLKQYNPAIEIVMLTIFNDDEHIFECLRYGASGYILKGASPEKILEAVQEVYNGGSPMSASIARRVVQHFKHPPANGAKLTALSEREKQLLTFLSKGSSYKMIAGEMKISVFTVQQHIKHIYTKLHVHNMGEAVAKALKSGII